MFILTKYPSFSHFSPPPPHLTLPGPQQSLPLATVPKKKYLKGNIIH